MKASPELIVALVCLFTATTSPAVLGAAPQSPPVALSVGDAGEVVLRARFEPVKSSMYRFHEQWDELRDFKAARPEQSHAHPQFRGFLPDRPVAVGETWALSADAVLPFLRQFHPGATLDLHLNNGDSPGAFAILRALNDRYAEVAFRIHCEFVLKEGWLTPGQMAGRLVLDRRAGTVAYFHMHLPPAQVNFDTGRRLMVTKGPGPDEPVHDIVATDAGCIPRMELTGGERLPEGTRWAPALPDEAAAHRLASLFYRYKQIEMVDFDEALALARQTGKPLHAVALEGTIDDESC